MGATMTPGPAGVIDSGVTGRPLLAHSHLPLFPSPPACASLVLDISSHPYPHNPKNYLDGGNDLCSMEGCASASARLAAPPLPVPSTVGNSPPPPPSQAEPESAAMPVTL